MTDERRRFERIDLAYSAQVQVLDPRGRRLGVVRQLGRGGFMMEPEKSYAKDGKIYKFVIHEPQEDIRVPVTAKVRHSDARYAGFEFVDLEADAAVDLGIIIGKYYEAEHK